MFVLKTKPQKALLEHRMCYYRCATTGCDFFCAEHIFGNKMNCTVLLVQEVIHSRSACFVFV